MMEEKIDISFIVPIRGRENMKPYLENNIAEMFSKYNYEIIYVVQKDEEPFKAAQLRNIGFIHSNGEYIVTRDVDIVDIQQIDIIETYKQMGGPYRAFNAKQNLRPNSAGVLLPCAPSNLEPGSSGYSIFKRSDIEEKNGFTNLCIGWGCEDDIGRIVYGIKTVERVFGHIYHESNSFKDMVQFRRNYNIYKKYLNGEIDSQYDGYRQMTYDIVSEKQEGNIKTIEVNNIGVVSDFKYKDLLNI